MQTVEEMKTEILEKQVQYFKDCNSGKIQGEYTAADRAKVEAIMAKMMGGGQRSWPTAAPLIKAPQIRKMREVAGHIGSIGQMFNVSPDDAALRHNPKWIKDTICRHMNRSRIPFIIVSEHAPGKNNRLHYHGVALFKDIEQLDNVKRKIQREIGRVEHEAIRDVPYWKWYMFKSYTDAMEEEDENKYNPQSVPYPYNFIYSSQFVDELTA